MELNVVVIVMVPCCQRTLQPVFPKLAAALEIAAIVGDGDPSVGIKGAPLVDRLYPLLTGLSR
jgi:hypothetical protein